MLNNNNNSFFFDDACLVVVKGLQSIQLERGLRVVNSPGVIFEVDDTIQGQKESSVLLRNVVKPEDVDDPISMGGCAYFPFPLRVLISGLSPVEACSDVNRKADEDT